MPHKLGVRCKKSSGLLSAPTLSGSGRGPATHGTDGRAKTGPPSPCGSSQERSDRGPSHINMTPHIRGVVLDSPVDTAGLTTPLIPKAGTRPRVTRSTRYVPTDWDDSLPYGGKVYLARQKKPDTWLCVAIQVFLLLFAVGLVYYAWYYTEHMHFHTTKLYGQMGHTGAQAMTAEKYLHGKGVERNHSMAMEWYKKAALQGHPHSSYNLAIGHLQGLDVGLQPGEAHELIKHAAENGVVEAADVLAKVCSRGKCV